MWVSFLAREIWRLAQFMSVRGSSCLQNTCVFFTVIQSKNCEMTDRISDNRASTPQMNVRVGIQQGIVSVLLVAAICAMFEVVFFARVVCPQVESSIKQALESVAGSGALPNTSPLAIIAELADHRERSTLESHNRSGFVFGTGIALLPLCAALLMLHNNRWLRTRESITDIATSVLFVSTGVIAFQLFFYQLARRYRYASLTANISKVLKHYEENNAATCAHGNVQLDGVLKSASDRLGGMARGLLTGYGGGVDCRHLSDSDTRTGYLGISHQHT